MDSKLLLRYVMEKADRNERRQVVEWLNESPENMDRFSSLKAQFVFSSMPDTVLPEKKRRFLSTLTWAAAILFIPLLAGTIYLFIQRQDAVRKYDDSARQVERLLAQNPGSITYIANAGTKSFVILPDSSIVRLNGESKLIVPQCFNAGSRELYLSGQGYFEVRHHDDWPMLIHTSKGLTVKVLGTTFDLSAYEDDAAVKLTLVEGKVLIREDKTNSEVVVKPQQEINISDAPGTDGLHLKPVIKKADIQLNTAWVNGELIFNNTPMSDVIKQLERWYGVNIHVVNDDILKYHFTATFSTESINRVLDLIRFSSMLEYEINGKEVYISHSQKRV